MSEYHRTGPMCCARCDEEKQPGKFRRFITCPDCGNKRCPKATDHRNTCTASNEPGQPGSYYAAPPTTPGDET